MKGQYRIRQGFLDTRRGAKVYSNIMKALRGMKVIETFISVPNNERDFIHYTETVIIRYSK